MNLSPTGNPNAYPTFALLRRLLVDEALLHWRRYTFFAALGVSIVEIAIVVTKFALFLSAPEWNIWRTNWFINKLFVLACFVLLFGYLIANAKRLRGSGIASA